MARYAESTNVQADRSRADIEKVMMRHGARGFMYASDIGRAMIGFRILNESGAIVSVQITLPLPPNDDKEFTHTPTGKARAREAAVAAWEQACRASWRQLLLIVKAKLEAINAGISTIEREFMPDLVIGKDGRTLGHWMAENQNAIESGGTIPILPSVDK